MTDLPLTTRRRLWPLFLMPTLLLIAAIGWSVFWFILGVAGRPHRRQLARPRGRRRPGL